MQDEKMAQSVEALERKAEEVLEDANKKAEEIRINGRIEADKILISELPTDTIDSKCHETIQLAAEEAAKMKISSSKHCNEIKANADSKIAKMVDNIVGIITGIDQA